MEQHRTPPPPPLLNLEDVKLILLRRKWLILAFWIAGMIAGGVFYVRTGVKYSSEAKLFIRYVLDKKLPAGAGSDSQIIQPSSSGANIIGSEVEVLTSYDLAQEVAEKVGPQKLIDARSGVTPTKQAAASVISAGLKVEVPRNSDVVRITFQHEDPSVVQPVLSQLIASYMRKHDEIHRASGLFDEVLTQQTDSLRSQVAQTEDELRKLHLKTGIASLEDTKKAYTEEISRVRQEINDTQAQMAEKQASLSFMVNSNRPPAPAVETHTNIVQADTQTMNRYRTEMTRLDSLRKREQELLKQFTPGNAMVADVQAQIADCEKTVDQLEKEFPSLLSTSVPGVVATPATAPSFDPNVESARIVALQAKLGTLQKLFEKLTTDINAVHEAEPELLRLQRKKELDEAQYRHFQSSLEQARFDEALGSGRLSNIGVAQSPSPAFRESTKVLKTVGMLVAAGLALGCGLAFLLELYLKPVVKSASELERRVRDPLFITIPSIGSNGEAKAHRAIGNGDSKADGAPQPEPATQVVRWDPSSRLQVYYEGLRDRLITWFENNNLTRKPKLVAVTSCNNGAGVSSIAAGLAATLSETGDGRVLLVDMNVGQGAAHSFYKGRPGCGLDEALKSETRDDTQVKENLFVVAEGASNRDRLPSVLPRRFTSLVPKLKASDFDYIIFDMPPVSPVTMTPRLSAYMDMVLLVVEAEKTPHDALKRASHLLTNARASVGTVLNKVKSGRA